MGAAPSLEMVAGGDRGTAEWTQRIDRADHVIAILRL